MNRIIQVFFILFLTIDCSDKNKIPSNILSPLIMQQVMWDMIRADEFVSGFIWKNDSAINRQNESTQLYEKIFQIHHVTKQQFQKSLIFCREHPNILKIIVDSLNADKRLLNGQIPGNVTEDSRLLRKPVISIQ